MSGYLRLAFLSEKRMLFRVGVRFSLMKKPLGLSFLQADLSSRLVSLLHSLTIMFLLSADWFFGFAPRRWAAETSEGSRESLSFSRTMLHARWLTFSPTVTRRQIWQPHPVARTLPHRPPFPPAEPHSASGLRLLFPVYLSYRRAS